MRPGDGYVGGARERHLVGRTVHFGDHHDARAGRQLGEPAPDRRQCGLVAHQQVPVELGRDDERAARPADAQGLTGRCLLGPSGRRAGIVQHELDLQAVGDGIVAPRRVVARRRRPLAVGARRRIGVGKEQLHVVVEAEAHEPFEIAAQRDADHVRGDPLDALHRELAPARLMAHAPRGARREVRRCNGGYDRHVSSAPIRLTWCRARRGVCCKPQRALRRPDWQYSRQPRNAL